ncbi:hypothetical protein [Rhodoferax sp. WC2427]|uniref:hypothetical protein n=1 Tax=Rhodoferax sp. WC2427 TaxID=3234144 RepID=UPI00346777C1
MKNKLLAIALLSVAFLAQAETSPAKKELLNKIAQLQQPNLDLTARQWAELSLAPLLQQVGAAIQFRVAPENREALGKDIQAEVKKYLDDIGPVLRERANKAAPGTIGAMLDAKFSEDELRQLITVMESPVLRKYSQLNAEMQKALTDKVMAESKAQLEPRFKALGQAVEKRLNTAIQASVPAKPASK